LATFLIHQILNRTCPASPTCHAPVIVEATGRNFQWWFRYPGADGDLGTPDDIQSNRFLMLPPDVDVTILLASEDYIYTMSLPPYGLREIAVPDLIHKLVFHTKTWEEFDLLVDPLCSFRFYHDEVMGRVSIAPRRDFSTWFGLSKSSHDRS